MSPPSPKNGPSRRLLADRLSLFHEVVRDELAVRDRNEDIPELSAHAKSVGCYGILRPIAASRKQRTHRSGCDGVCDTGFRHRFPGQASAGSFASPDPPAWRSL